MKELGCYTDGQRQEIDTASTWACPASAGLNNAQRLDRECQSREEFIKVKWMPSWEPEDIKETWPRFKECLLKFEAKQNEPDLSQPTADSVLSNLERQGFVEPHDINIWRQKLDTELRNK
eukprot:910327-Pelagomonas_calceolata.AAC.1